MGVILPPQLAYFGKQAISSLEMRKTFFLNNPVEEELAFEQDF
jgi:hypothetical protein